MAEPFRFQRRARRPAGLAVVAIALVTLAALIFLVDANPVIVVVVALITAPAAWEVLRDSHSLLHIDDEEISWTSGRRSRRVPLGEIDEVILSTSLDFSQRANLRLSGGPRLRIPPDCLPPGRVLDTEFTARNVAHRRSLFGF